jgi:hypothetical protein
LSDGDRAFVLDANSLTAVPEPCGLIVMAMGPCRPYFDGSDARLLRANRG